MYTVGVVEGIYYQKKSVYLSPPCKSLFIHTGQLFGYQLHRGSEAPRLALILRPEMILCLGTFPIRWVLPDLCNIVMKKL